MAEEHATKQSEVHLQVERVQYRSAAWRELWRRIFAAIGEDFQRKEATRANRGLEDADSTDGNRAE